MLDERHIKTLQDFITVRNCTNKRRFETEQECRDSIEKAKADIPLRPYQCPICNGWHKTKHFMNVLVKP